MYKEIFSNVFVFPGTYSINSKQKKLFNQLKYYDYLFEMHFRGSFSFNGNVKIINGSLEFPIKVPTQKAKAILYKDQIYIANFKSFTNQRSDSTSKLNSTSKSSILFFYGVFFDIHETSFYS